MKLRIVCLALLIAICSKCDAYQLSNTLDGNRTFYRLPNNSIPIRYDLWLKTDVDKENFDFQGRVNIRIKILERTQQITLHYRQTEIDTVDLVMDNRSRARQRLEFKLDEKLEFLTISLPRMMNADDVLILEISYHGTLRSDNAGFYKAFYTDEFNETIWYATTQFQATDARHAMPCYDEPGIRAKIGVKVQHDKSYDAVSNMPIISRDPMRRTNYVTTKFRDTPPMQTYLLALLISNFKYKSNRNSKVEQRIYAKPSSIDAGEGDLALSVFDEMLTKYEEYFNVPFPLPKIDHAAITQFNSGGMENIGLVTYQEGNILVAEADKSLDKEKSTVQIISHEFAHQWFGNIVSPQDWQYLWLNEGFASLYEFYIPNLIWPDKSYNNWLLLIAITAADRDTEETDSKPLNYYPSTSEDIDKKFGPESYMKAVTFIRMFQEALTVPTFTKGVSYYLKDMYFKAATPTDLHRNLQKAYDEDFPENDLDIDKAMLTWEDQAGSPVVHVEKLTNKFILTQKRYKGGDEMYSIPISYATNSSPDFNNKTAKLWMNTKSIEIPRKSGDDWIILNMQLTSYYKVSYDKSTWNAIIRSLKTDLNSVDLLNRGQLFCDILISLEQYNLDDVQGLELLSTLRDERKFYVWRRTPKLFKYFSDYLFNTTTLPKYHQFIQSVIQPNLNRLGPSALRNELTNDGNLRGMVVEYQKNKPVSTFDKKLNYTDFNLEEVDAWLSREISRFQ